MTSRPLDTDPAAWFEHCAAIDRMGGPARVRAAIEMSEAVREIRLAGIQSRRPELTRKQAVARLVFEEYGIVLPGSR